MCRSGGLRIRTGWSEGQSRQAFAAPGETAVYQCDRGPGDQRLGVLDEPFVVAGMATGVHHPGQGTFDDPAPGRITNPVLSFGRATVLIQVQIPLRPGRELACVGSVSPDDGDPSAAGRRVDHEMPLAAIELFACAGVLSDRRGSLHGLRADDGGHRPGPSPISRRMRCESWSRIWLMIPAAAQRAMKPQTVRHGVLWNQICQAPRLTLADVDDRY